MILALILMVVSIVFTANVARMNREVRGKVLLALLFQVLACISIGYAL